MKTPHQPQRASAEAHARLAYRRDHLGRANERAEPSQLAVIFNRTGEPPRHGGGGQIGSAPSEIDLIDHEFSQRGEIGAGLTVRFESTRMREGADWELGVEELQQPEQRDAVSAHARQERGPGTGAARAPPARRS